MTLDLATHAHGHQRAKRRFIFLMLDGVGAGELPDSPEYGDAGSDTLGNLSRAVDLHLPTFERLGLGNILPVLGVPPTAEPLCLTGRLAPLSAGKDTTVGHWEHMGLITEHPFPTYPLGFPEEVLAPFRAAIGRGVLGNKPASGTAIIAELGEEHLRDGWPIVYTSADSVFQIAAHTGVVPLELLYEWCETARSLLIGPHAVARVIARPFTGEPGSFTRTKDRRDFSLAPPTDTYLDLLHGAGVPVLALGKISEVFVGRGVTTKIKVANNDENLDLVSALVAGTSDRASLDEGLLFTNLVDFDMVWGHRNDSEGFARGLEAVDRALPALLASLRPDDRLIISADHGVDPTTPSTDHSREYVPLLYYPRPAGAPRAVYEGFFSDTGASICSYLLGGAAPVAGGTPAEAGSLPGTPSVEGPASTVLPGRDVAALDPGRGWRRYTPTQASPPDGLPLPGRVGQEEANEAAAWLRDHLGTAPHWAVVLGSGLAGGFPEERAARSPAPVAYHDVPHWLSSAVAGHGSVLSLSEVAGERVLLLRGRAHGYEGLDLSQTQLVVRTLAAWGVRAVIAASAAGAVSSRLVAGDLMLVREIVDLQQMPAGGPPLRFPGVDPALLEPGDSSDGTPHYKTGVHAAVPGPQYETRTELALLDALGVDSVSMSLAAETAAARDEGMLVVPVAVIANAGPPSHEEVLAGAGSAGAAFARLVGDFITHHHVAFRAGGHGVWGGCLYRRQAGGARSTHCGYLRGR